ncbi:Ig-like domain-containing protein, partial [Streptococcus sp. S784/96/1]|uniref:Ig-like domain-containing protein n=1 Tax=Streptococcus sp. S784/96/1 TaxID=2653499 RepID=UPI0013872898
MSYQHRVKRNISIYEEKRKIKYGLKKLSVGVVSCIIGCTIFFDASVAVYAEGSYNEHTGVYEFTETKQKHEISSTQVTYEKVETEVNGQKVPAIKYTFIMNPEHFAISGRTSLGFVLPKAVKTPSKIVKTEYYSNNQIAKTKEYSGISEWANAAASSQSFGTRDLKKGKFGLMETTDENTGQKVKGQNIESFDKVFDEFVKYGYQKEAEYLGKSIDQIQGYNELMEYRNGDANLVFESWESTNKDVKYVFEVYAPLKDPDKKDANLQALGFISSAKNGTQTSKYRMSGIKATLDKLEKSGNKLDTVSLNSNTAPVIHVNEPGSDTQRIVVYRGGTTEIPGVWVEDKEDTQLSLDNQHLSNGVNSLNPKGQKINATYDKEGKKVVVSPDLDASTGNYSIKIGSGEDGSEKVRDSAGAEADSAEIFILVKEQTEKYSPIKPDTPVVVGDKDALTPEEKQKVEDAVKAKNPDLPDKTTVTAGNDGTVTVTYPDGSIDTVSGTDVVKEQDQSAQPTVNTVDSDDPSVGGTGTAGSTIKVTFPGVKDPVETTVGQDGNWSVGLPEGVDLNAGDKVSVTQTETGKKESTAVEKSVEQTTAEKTDVKKPDTPVVVGDKDALTPEEKQKVEDAVKAKNPDLPDKTTVTAG